MVQSALLYARLTKITHLISNQYTFVIRPESDEKQPNNLSDLIHTVSNVV